MRAVAITVADGTQCPAIQHFDEPTLCPGEALVAVKAFSLNNGEIRGALVAAAGHRPGSILPASLKTHPTDLAFRLVIESWASSLMALGGERIAADTTLLAPIPDAVSFEAASVLPVAGLTASIALSKNRISVAARF